MYAVSDAYETSMDESFRNPVTVEAELLNLDAVAQAAFTVSSTTAISACTPSGITKVATDNKPEKATAEPNLMTADGTYNLASANYYISDEISSYEPNEFGRYLFLDAPSVLLTITDNWTNASEKPITIYTNTDVAQLSIDYTFSDGSSQGITRTILDGKLVVEAPSIGKRYSTIRISVVYMFAPSRRARIKNVYIGSSEVLNGNDILSLSYSDINDCVGLELPQKKVTCSINNLSGAYDPEIEYTSPSFIRWNTQALIWFVYDLERVPMGRVFMDAYKVSNAAVSFEFVGALGMLNEFTHWWSTKTSAPLSTRLAEVMYVDTAYVDYSEEKKPHTAAETYGITLDTTSAANKTMYSANPCPNVSTSQALQLYTNLSGNVLRDRRTTKDIEVISIPRTSTAIRSITANVQYGNPEYDVDDKIGTVTANQYSLGTTSQKIICTNNYAHASYEMVDGYFADAPVSSMSLAYVSEGNVVLAISYWYSYYYQARQESIAGITATATLYDLVNEPQSFYYREGTTLKLSNPLLNKENELETYPIQSYADRVYNELKYNVNVTLSHRGYPELDAGDIIAVQTKVGGSFVKARVLENKFTITNGAMRGTTKVRRLE